MLVNTTNWPATLNNYVEFTGVQVEKGNIATPFEFRPLAIEIELCRRYYRRYNETNGGNGVICTGVATAGSTGIQAMLPLIPQMRDTPAQFAVSHASHFRFFTNGNASFQASAFTLGGASDQSSTNLFVGMTLSNVVNATQIIPGYVTRVNAANGFIEVGAEL